MDIPRTYAEALHWYVALKPLAIALRSGREVVGFGEVLAEFEKEVGGGHLLLPASVTAVERRGIGRAIDGGFLVYVDKARRYTYVARMVRLILGDNGYTVDLSPLV